ncbi:MAG: MOSC domain-containing protein [Alphaproteobacteria bacterium]|nr:MOSC domain-containing protein [Alphaproteobacteria bacterium SS10]
MPILNPTEIYGEVVTILVNSDREADLTSSEQQAVEVTYAGFAGEDHGGLTRPSCSRVKAQYERGTEIRNTRQVTIISTEELAEIGEAMGIGEPVKPEWIGANLVLTGIPLLTQLPPSSRLIFEGPAGEEVSLVVDMENGPCRFPGEVIDQTHPGLGKLFPKAALGRRGVTAWVEHPGQLAVGAKCRLHIPPQRLYTPAMTDIKAAE